MVVIAKMAIVSSRKEGRKEATPKAAGEGAESDCSHKTNGVSWVFCCCYLHFVELLKLKLAASGRPSQTVSAFWMNSHGRCYFESGIQMHWNAVSSNKYL